MYSVASRASFDDIRAVHHRAMFERKGGKPNFVLAGNMYDKNYAREVSYEEGKQLAQELGCPFFETSAKSAYNVEHLFMALVRLMRLAQPVMPQSEYGGGEAKSGGVRGFKTKGCITM